MPLQDGRAYSLCRDFHEGRCTRRSCRFSHSIVDTVRFKRLVGDLSDIPADHTSPLLVMKCTKSGTTGRGLWEVKLLGGGRATLDNYGWSIGVQPQYPMQSTSSHLGEALSELEMQLFGQRYPVRNQSICRHVPRLIIDVLGFLGVRRARRYGVHDLCPREMHTTQVSV